MLGGMTCNTMQDIRLLSRCGWIRISDYCDTIFSSLVIDLQIGNDAGGSGVSLGSYV
jgi:hypothetical protein